ncbi:hypothetical protein KC865_01570 [Candidatus Kaiserbacteria bacterium]|nr:hypothetical protein [Candidatus Kaiserbacteria bacterium]
MNHLSEKGNDVEIILNNGTTFSAGRTRRRYLRVGDTFIARVRRINEPPTARGEIRRLLAYLVDCETNRVYATVIGSVKKKAA